MSAYEGEKLPRICFLKTLLDFIDSLLKVLDNQYYVIKETSGMILL